jgi:hypothetical protein
MPSLAILSFFRNSAASGQAQRFMRQAALLRDAWGGPVRVIAVWGDCADATPHVLMRQAEEHGLALQLHEHSHGGPVFGSTEAPARLIALSRLGNAGLELVRETDDLVLYVESDLIWTANTIAALAAHVLAGETQVCAPLIFAGEAFYDIWAFRKNGHRFGPFYPFHGELRHDGQLTDVDSAGSCLLMRGEVARACRMAEGSCLVGLCADAWAKGFRVAVDASLRVVHP